MRVDISFENPCTNFSITEPLCFKGGNFLKKLWCWVGGRISHGNLEKLVVKQLKDKLIKLVPREWESITG